MNETKMNLSLEELLSSEDYLPPDDPLGELTSFELGIRRFCYDQNRVISIEIGGQSKKEVFLFPDICLLIERLCSGQEHAAQKNGPHPLNPPLPTLGEGEDLIKILTKIYDFLQVKVPLSHYWERG